MYYQNIRQDKASGVAEQTNKSPLDVTKGTKKKEIHRQTFGFL